jgi:hypothetical protein
MPNLPLGAGSMAHRTSHTEVEIRIRATGLLAADDVELGSEFAGRYRLRIVE